MKKYFYTLILLFFSVLCLGQNNNFILAENYYRNTEYEKAAQLYKQLVQKSPYNNLYFKRLISCYQETNQFDKAENILTSSIKQNPKLTFLYVMLGYNYDRQQQEAKAKTYYEKALASIDVYESYAGTIAGLFKDYAKLDYAIKAYEKASAKNENANYGFQVAQIYGEKGDFKSMFDQYINFVDKDDYQLNTVKRFSARYVSDDSEDPNNKLFKQALLRKSASNPKAIWNDLLSWLFTKQKDYNKAYIQQKALYARDPDNLSGMKQLGKIAFENTDYEAAKKCFDFVIEKTMYPRDRFNAIQMKMMIAVKNKEEDIEQQFEAVFKEHGINSNTFPIQLVYADYLTFEKNKPEEARKIIEKGLETANTPFNKTYGKYKLADILVYQGYFNQALIYYTQIYNKTKLGSLPEQVQFKIAQTSYFKGDFKWAKAQLKVLKKSASKLIANDAADLFLLISDNEPKDSTDTSLKTYAKADLLSYQNQLDDAIVILDTLINDFKGQSIEDDALYKQAFLLVKKEAYNKAIENYEALIKMGSETIYVDDALYYLAELYQSKLNNPEKAQEYYQKIIFDHASSIYLVDARKKYRKLRGDTIN
ncbi:tetratricopeptide repeat protein [Tenacibaculum geojense]|uniref:Tetratricopeptide repeat protein n=1 Tax=Tenacibaculum geojense TaxID=915352 RepID=A0ABW3JQ77_9FLAO